MAGPEEPLRKPVTWIEFFSVTFHISLHERSSEIPECMKNIDLEQGQNQTLARCIEKALLSSSLNLTSKNFRSKQPFIDNFHDFLMTSPDEARSDGLSCALPFNNTGDRRFLDTAMCPRY